MSDKNGKPPTQQINDDIDNSIPLGEADVIPVLLNYLTSKLWKDERADFLNVFEDDRDHRFFGCYSDDNAFETKAIDEVATDASMSRLKSIVDDDNNNDIVDDTDKSIIKLEINCSNKNKLKIYNPTSIGWLLHQI